MGRKLRQSEAGFTLIEVLVAAVILVVAFALLGVVFANAQSQATADVGASQLVNLADQQMELVRSDVGTSGFPSLTMSAVPQPVTLPAGVSAGRENSWTDANKYVNGTTPDADSSAACLQIEANYDGSTGGTAPTGFNPWSNCATTDGEPLAVPSVSTAGSIVTVNVQGNSAWPANAWPPACPAAPAVATPCTATLGPTTHVTVYTFVTYSYAACGVTTSSPTGLINCPTVSSTGTVTGCTTGTTATPFPTAATASTPCADGRRVTVAVVPQETKTLSRQTGVYISSLFTNPTPSTSQSSTLGLQLDANL